ncbi:MAG TPA: TerC family protein, partial [Propionicimonas sp.]|nr:TerC family protein [Propionicimonas sp.]HRA06742.1 TerC family protein [Propionicimonas sp.]
MHVTPEIWLITIGVMVAVLAVDLLIIGRRPHEPSMREAGIAIGVFSGLAVLFGLGIWWFVGARFA